MSLTRHVVPPEEIPETRAANPKRSRSQGEEWYPYYAGFSPEFVVETLDLLGLPAGKTVLDPWNGSGTTTACALELGYNAIGFDINPVMATVALARTGIAEAMGPLLRSPTRWSYARQTGESEPLLWWFSKSSASAIRAIADEIARRQAHGATGASSESSDRALRYTALFLAVRSLLSKFGSTNPTWIRTASRKKYRISPETRPIRDSYQAYVEKLHSLRTIVGNGASAIVAVADSKQMPIASNSVDVALTSPPYCTRLDYAVACSPELAILGISPGSKAIRRLRDSSIGTPTIWSHVPLPSMLWGPKCASFLCAMESHASKASAGYYLKTHMQYFDAMSRSMIDLDRVLVPAGKCVMVVQDSRYKELHNDVPGIVVEMAELIGWKLCSRKNFPVKQTLADTNPHSKNYRSSSRATESVLVFTTSSSQRVSRARRIEFAAQTNPR